MSSSTKSTSSCSEDDNNQLRRGPWTPEEDNLLIQFIAHHGDGRWNLLAKRSGLRRTGKSCRLRWLNYLKPDVKRGNLSAQEQLLILDLHSKWGNRWSKIAQHLPGRTDNEIKNYWRTRVQKQAKYLNIDTKSQAFQEIVQCYWVPRLLQKIEESAPAPAPAPSAAEVPLQRLLRENDGMNSGEDYLTSSCNSSSHLTQISDYRFLNELHQIDNNGYGIENFASATGEFCHALDQCHVAGSHWMGNDFAADVSNMDELWQFNI